MLAARTAAEVANLSMSLLDVHVHMLVKHNYIAYSSIAVQSSNSLNKFYRLFTFGDQDEGPQGPGTKGVKSGTVPAIRGPLRPMVGCPIEAGFMMPDGVTVPQQQVEK